MNNIIASMPNDMDLTHSDLIHHIGIHMATLAVSIGLICCCLGVVICLYGAQGFLLHNHSWPLLLIVGISMTFLGVVIVGISGLNLYQERKQKEEHSAKISQ